MLHTTLHRITAEFMEMPGLRISIAQAARLWAMEPHLCHAVLEALVDAKFLSRAHDGSYKRAADGRHIPAPHAAKAHLQRRLAQAS